MKLLITGICGFAGSTLARPFREHFADWSISGVDNLSRPGSEINASENMALEYHSAFSVPVWINRCGTLAGAGQFGRPDRGIFSFWINSYLRNRRVCYRGFSHKGFQVRDCLHPRELVQFIARQMQTPNGSQSNCVNVSGGLANSMSLAQLSEWCSARFGQHWIASELISHRFDVPWLILDSRYAAKEWHWKVETPINSILEEIGLHAEAHPEWLQLSGAENE